MNEETKKDAAKVPEVHCWQWFTQMEGTEHERRSYYMTLRDGEKELKFILRAHANGTTVAEPYVDHEYDYDYNYDDDDERDEDDDSYCEDDSDEEEE